MAGKRRRDRTEVSCVIKYLVFGFNVAFWLIGGLLCAAGIWAWTEKDMFGNLGQLTSITVDPALICIIAGGIIFVIGFTGCIGALRENMCLLAFYSGALGVIFLIQVVFAILAFIYKDWMKDQVENELQRIIVKYRDDPDLQNLIDWVQGDWLQCCGVKSYNDWENNIYFNCSSPSREACGVPFSCCKEQDDAIENRQCGYDSRDSGEIANAEVVIYTVGCLDKGFEWLERNLIVVAGVVVGVALAQIVGICFAQNLRSDIQAQRAKWYRSV